MAAASGNSHRVCQRNGRWQHRVATRIGFAQLMGRWQRRVATRVGLAQQNGRWHQRVATRIGLAQPNECGLQRLSEEQEWQLALVFPSQWIAQARVAVGANPNSYNANRQRLSEEHEWQLVLVLLSEMDDGSSE